MKEIVLPGSEGEAGAAAGGGGRLSGEDVLALAQVAHWWRHRLARVDATDPLESAFGGVDDSGAARTVGAAAATVVFPRLLVAPPGGVGLWVVALGVPNPPTAGQVYSLAGLCHFYRDAGGGWLIDGATVACVPADAGAEIRAVLIGPPTNTPALQVAGVAGITIDWKVEVYRVERN